MQTLNRTQQIRKIILENEADKPIEEVVDHLPSDYLYGLFSGLEKMRFSMSGIQIGCLPRMQVVKNIPEHEIIAVQHSLLESMKMYSTGMMQSAESLSLLLNHLEHRGIDLSKLKELMPEMLKEPAKKKKKPDIRLN